MLREMTYSVLQGDVEVQRRQNEHTEATCKGVVKMGRIWLSNLHDKERVDVTDVREAFVGTATLRLGILESMS